MSQSNTDSGDAVSEVAWRSIVSAIPDIDTWNRNLAELKRVAERDGPECKAFFAAEAKRRGYIWSTLDKAYFLPWMLRACRGKNLIGAGWREGQLAVVFSHGTGSVRYESESHDLPEVIADKLCNSPYPDKLYQQIVAKKGIKMVKVV